MPRLCYLLAALERLKVGPEEIRLPPIVYRDLLDQAEDIVAEETYLTPKRTKVPLSQKSSRGTISINLYKGGEKECRV